MDSPQLLLPVPRNLLLSESVYALPSQALLVISHSSLLFEAQSLQSAISQFANLNWDIVAGTNYPNIGVELRLDDSQTHPEGYQLSITSSGITVTAKQASGIFYGVCTLNQLLQQYQTQLPCLTIDDWPDFPARGVMLDISRDKVPTLQTILDLVEKLATLKVNQLQLYMEHTFAYRNHPDVWAEATPFTGEDILKLDAYCRQNGVELVPNQNSLGHTERWLKHARYSFGRMPRWLRITLGGHSPPPPSIRSTPAASNSWRCLYDELLPHFTSKLLNVGGDEPWELGKGKSKSEVEARGGRVYLDYITKLHREVTARGHKMQFWGDIIVHYPDLVPELPKDVTAMLWGYARRTIINWTGMVTWSVVTS
nr:chitinase [uncultured bacterium]